MAEKRELRMFGVAMALLCGVLNFVFVRHLDAPRVAAALWTVGGLLLLLALVRPTALRPVQRAWMFITWPLRLVLSHLALGLAFFGILTPIGWLLRVRGHDPLRLRAPRDESSLWTEVKSDDDPERAFQQF